MTQYTNDEVPLDWNFLTPKRNSHMLRQNTGRAKNVWTTEVLVTGAVVAFLIRHETNNNNNCNNNMHTNDLLCYCAYKTRTYD